MGQPLFWGVGDLVQVFFPLSWLGPADNIPYCKTCRMALFLEGVGGRGVFLLFFRLTVCVCVCVCVNTHIGVVDEFM